MAQAIANLGINLGSFLWQLAAFVVLLLLLRRYAFGPVTRMLDERAARIRQSIETAERVQREMAEAEQRTRQMLEEAQRQRQQIAQQAQQAADRIQADAQERARTQANEIVARAQVDIDKMRAEAIDDLRRQVADLAIMAASRVIRRELDPATHTALINDVLSESASRTSGGRPVA